MRQLRLALAALITALTALTPAAAQNYPSRTIRVIVPFTAGGAVDTMARLVAVKLADQVGQPVVIENKPGAGGIIGADMVAKAAPDGYTILQNTAGASVAPALYKSLPYDAYKDHMAVTQISTSIFVLVAGPKSGIRSVSDLVARAKAAPGKLNYGSSGTGNPLQLTMEMFNHASGIDILAVPFRGDPQINAAVMAGDIEVAVVPIATAVPLINDGRLVALGTTGAKRRDALPDVPTIQEQGVPGFEAYGWQGWFMPAGTPVAAINRIQAEMAKILAQPEVRARFRAMGNEVVGSTPAEFDAYYRAEIVKFAKVIADANIPKQ
jgi:tripartite-type tricarboxylate transporter receptor subunit TctC